MITYHPVLSSCTCSFKRLAACYYVCCMILSARTVKDSWKVCLQEAGLCLGIETFHFFIVLASAAFGSVLDWGGASFFWCSRARSHTQTARTAQPSRLLAQLAVGTLKVSQAICRGGGLCSKHSLDRAALSEIGGKAPVELQKERPALRPRQKTVR
eukprot:6456116-Amphidinium_carterae.2